jgi:integrase
LKTEPTKLDGCDCPIWAHGRVRGKFLRESLSTRSVVTALLKKDELLRGRDDDPTPGGGIAIVGKTAAQDGATVTLAHAVDEFLASKKRKKSSSQTVYTRAVTHFRIYAEAHGWEMLRSIDTPQIQQYLAEYDSGWKRNTAQGRLNHLRTFFNWCAAAKRRWIPYSPAADRDLSYPVVERTRLPFTLEEVTRIMTVIEQLPDATRDVTRALALLMLYTGMRISDATFFERACLTERNTADYWIIKTGKRINLPPEVHQRALDALGKLPLTRSYFFQEDRDDDYREARAALRNGKEFALSMPGYEARRDLAMRLVRNALKRAGLEGGCHRFRDTFAINMLMASKDNLYAVSKMLGHSDIRITEHYLKLIPGYRERMSQTTRQLAYIFPEAAA